MFRQFTMIILAFVVLLGSAHAASWSHDHADGDDHALVLTHSDDSDHGQMVGHETPSDSADLNGDVVGHHSHPFGIAVAAVTYGVGGATRRTVTAIAPARRLVSFNQAPPTQPPSA